MLSRLVRTQLVLFALITVAALVIMSLFYIRLPEQLGFGRYDVTMELDEAGGLYPKAHVTYRGIEVGQVKKLEIRDGGGVRVHLQIDDDADIPAGSRALVRSASVIGEQYVNFVPQEGASTDRFLAEGDVVKTDLTDLPTSTDDVLDAVDNLVTSIPTDALEVTLDELDTAFRGTGDDLGSLISSASEFVTEANDNVEATVALINDATPVLQTQVDMDANIRRLVTSLDGVTGALADNKQGLKEIFEQSSPFIQNIGDWALEMDKAFPRAAADLAAAGEVLHAYQPALEHTLIEFPAMQTMFNAVLPVSRRDDPLQGLNLHLRVGLDTPVCTEGFVNANRYRNPDDKTLLPVGADTYCKVAPDSPLVVRGARNSPCPNGPLRGPYAFNCGLVFDEAAVAEQREAIAAGDQVNDPNGANPSEAGASFLDNMLGADEGESPSLETILLGLTGADAL